VAAGSVEFLVWWRQGPHVCFAHDVLLLLLVWAPPPPLPPPSCQANVPVCPTGYDLSSKGECCAIQTR
jgi:hypothetical protein